MITSQNYQGGYTKFFNGLEDLKDSRKPKSLLKQLFRMRLGMTTGEGLPYPDHNAQTMGDFRYIENLKMVCGQNVAWFEGVTSGDFYLKELSCRKQWCPECGGKGGTIHKTRIHSMLKRVDAKKYNLQQFVFTIPDHLRENFKTKKALHELFKMARKVIEKYFGVAELDRFGHVKRYRMEKGCISYLHVFGEELGVFKPHINVHIVRDRSALLRLPEDVLSQIKSAWGDQLRKYDASIQDDFVNMKFNFRIGEIKVGHALKYMLRPWSAEHYEAITDEDLKKLLVVDMNGFQYFRYWGALANCSYKDEMDISEIRQDAETKVNELLIYRFISPFDVFAWSLRLEKIDDGLYRVKGPNHEPEKGETKEKDALQ